MTSIVLNMKAFTTRTGGGGGGGGGGVIVRSSSVIFYLVCVYQYGQHYIKHPH